MIKVYLSDPIVAEAQALLAKHVDLDVGHELVPKEEFLHRIKDVEVIFNKTDPVRIDAEVIDAAPKLKLIARHGTGYSNVDVAYAASKGIMVTTTQGANTIAIAEYTLGLMLCLSRKLMQAREAGYAGDPNRLQFMGTQLFGKTLGILSVGSIAKEVIKRASALGMTIIAYHPRPSAKNLSDLPLRLVDLPELLQLSDFISIHSPLNEQTKNMLDAHELKQMKPTVKITNLSRGGIVNEQALFEFLQNNPEAGYATDVLLHEPVKKEEPLLALKNVLILPHIAAVTEETQKAIAMTAVEGILAFAAGKRPKYVLELN